MQLSGFTSAPGSNTTGKPTPRVALFEWVFEVVASEIANQVGVSNLCSFGKHQDGRACNFCIASRPTVVWD